MKNTLILLIIASLSLASTKVIAQYVDTKKVDASTKLYLAKPGYKTPYGETKPEAVKGVIDRILVYLEETTPIGVIDKTTKEEITDYKNIDENSIIKQGTFSITNYMWGVTYSSMLSAAKITGDERYKEYVSDRFQFLTAVAPYFAPVLHKDNSKADPQMRQLLRPLALDDAGAMCSAMIKAKLDGMEFNGQAIMDRYFDWIINKEYRLPDGTFARNRPQRNTIWLDDMFMGIPAIANMGRLTGDTKYYDEAIKQITQFADRMFLPEKGLYRHGWVEAMHPHPAFHWGRANGWALLTKVEVLDALPKDYPGREKVLKLLQAHIQGLCALQSSEGLWHQLLDRNDSYLETSASAIYVYCMAKAINEGWIDMLAYGSQTMLGWHGVTTKVNEKGQIEGTCVGTGMGYDPAFYYYRPVNTAAGHGYGPVIYAGAEMYRLLQNHTAKMNDSAVLFYKEKIDTKAAIFYVEEDGVVDHH
ncbi:glycoside hydrolase family 88 protein [uncultured Draconibacterium sp.]|uniref:glycoside hydrolase family 88/105 protein n=1 Tax=uncultured Draconibacterium sp. TaxID=1573823 RepID=UPI0025FB5029|nr:glycoside hydrolase family 88 protein [uncultured Draconibacterium sp.]